jgi:peroxiredoxin Q/BCP
MATSKKKASKKASKKAAKKTAKKSVKKATKKSAKKAARKAAKKVAKKASTKAIKKSVKKAAVTGTKGTAPKAAKAPSTVVVKEGTVIADRFVLVRDGMVSLSSLVGEKGLVLYFYPKDATPGCTQEACDFRDAQAGLSGLGYSVVGVSPDSSDSHQKFAMKQSLNFPLISDADHSLCSDFGVWGEKQLYGRSFMGVIRSTFILDRELRVRKVFSPVRVAGHAGEVEHAIRSV